LIGRIKVNLQYSRNYNIVEIRLVFQRNLIVQGPECSKDNTDAFYILMGTKIKD
jgi:hypothetical protein